MNKIIKYALTLGLLSLLVSVILFSTYFLTKPIIDEQEIKEVLNYLNEVDDSLKWEKMSIKETEVEAVYTGKKEGIIKMYAFKVKTIGYGSGDIVSLTFVEKDLIKKVKIISMSNQTSGIGTQIENDEYLNSFIGNEINKYYLKEVDEFKEELISGATISSSALIKALINVSKIYEEIKIDVDLYLEKLNSIYENKNFSKKDNYYISDDKEYYAFFLDDEYLLYGDNYASLTIMLVIKDDLIDKVEVIKNSQTSEYGIKINDESYLDLYKGKNVEEYYGKNISDYNTDDFEIITSSTITSSAFLKLVINACDNYKEVKDE